MSDPDLGDLPSLRQWGDDLRVATGRAEQEQQRRRARRRRLPIRRLGVAVVAMFVLVPGAVATRSIWNDPVQRVAPLEPRGSTPAVRLAEGRTDGVSWRLGGYDAGPGQRCVQFDTLGDARPFSARGCTEPLTPAGITFLTAPTGRVGFVYGTVSADVRSIAITVAGGRRVQVGTTAVSPEVVRRSRIGAFRVFVATFSGGYSTSAEPQITAYDGAGNAIGALGSR
ncbi:MAG TPA: hypothetical protein VGM33_10965 [Baekduia sp.]